MKKIYKLLLCTFMCITVIFTCSAVISAASKVAKVKSVKVSSVTETTVKLKWKKTSGVTGYRVYKYSSKKDKYVYIGKTKKTTYTDSSLTAGKTYKYKVRAYKTKNKKTTYGAYSSAVKAVTAPKKVTGIKTTYVGSSNVSLSWKKAKGASGYEVFIYDSKKKKYVSKGTVTKTSCALKKLSSGTEYKVRIAAFHKKNGKVSGAKSSTFTFRTKLPEVNNLRVTGVTKSSYTLKWSKVKGAQGYMVYRYVSEEGRWKKVKTTSELSYSVKKLEPGTAYVYKVKAYKKNGSKTNYGGYSAQVTANTIPEAPTNLTAATDNKVVYLNWKTHGKATGYEISRFNTYDNAWETIGKTDGDDYTDESLTATGTYTYRVRAYVGENAEYTTTYTASVSIFFESNYTPQSVYGDSVIAEAGVLGFLLDPNEGCFYTASDPWQRRIGYNEGFDMGASLVTIYIDTVRVKFEYGTKDWMLQLWKGQYGPFFYGAEVGIYTKPKDRELDHYDCATDDESLMMSMDFYRSGVKKFSRPYDSYWWCTGFVPYSPLILVPGTTFTTQQARENLRVETRVVAKDYTMLSAMKASLDSDGVVSEGVSYYINGLNLYITYQ